MENNNKNVNHIYDGIVEQNNSMPGWWVWTFILTVIFGFLYWIHYSVAGGPTLMDEFRADLAAYEQKLAAAQNTTQVETEESLEKYMKNDAFILAGGKIYSEKCSMCHGVELEGKIGPNLVDNFWIHGKGTRIDLVSAVTKGFPAKGMPPWESMLKPNEIKNVVAFLIAKHGTNPPNPKAPDGTEVK